MFPRILNRIFEKVKVHKQFELEFEERGSHIWLCLRRWRKGNFYSVAVGVIDRHYGDANSELVVLGQVLCAIGSGAFPVSLSEGSNVLVEGYKEYLGSGYLRGLLDYRTFDVRLLKRCLKNCFHCVWDARPFFDD